MFGGSDVDRTRDLQNANLTLSQLSYTPKTFLAICICTARRCPILVDKQKSKVQIKLYHTFKAGVEPTTTFLQKEIMNSQRFIKIYYTILSLRREQNINNTVFVICYLHSSNFLTICQVLLL